MNEPYPPGSRIRRPQPQRTEPVRNPWGAQAPPATEPSGFGGPQGPQQAAQQAVDLGYEILRRNLQQNQHQGAYPGAWPTTPPAFGSFPNLGQGLVEMVTECVRAWFNLWSPLFGGGPGSRPPSQMPSWSPFQSSYPNPYPPTGGEPFPQNTGYPDPYNDPYGEAASEAYPYPTESHWDAGASSVPEEAVLQIQASGTVRARLQWGGIPLRGVPTVSALTPVTGAGEPLEVVRIASREAAPLEVQVELPESPPPGQYVAILYDPEGHGECGRLEVEVLAS
jgi:hypothetical protein